MPDSDYAGFYENRNGLVCKVNKGDQKNRGFTISNLQSKSVKVVWHDTGMSSPFQKVSEDDLILTLLLVADGSGSVDTIIVEKETGKFSRVAAGGFVGLYTIESIGTCR